MADEQIERLRRSVEPGDDEAAARLLAALVRTGWRPSSGDATALAAKPVRRAARALRLSRMIAMAPRSWRWPVSGASTLCMPPHEVENAFWRMYASARLLAMPDPRSMVVLRDVTT